MSETTTFAFSHGPENLDRANLVEPITVVRTYRIPVGPEGRHVPVKMAEDAYGERYAEIAFDPEK